MGSFQKIHFAFRKINTFTQFVIFLLSPIYCFSQENSISEILNGIWRINKNQEFALIYNNGKEYYYTNNITLDSKSYTSYLFLKKNLPQQVNQNKRFYSKDFMEKDRVFDFVDEAETVNVVFFKEKNFTDSIKIYTSVFLKFFKNNHDLIEIVEPKQYPNINYYERVIQPTKEVLSFLKKITPERFKKIANRKSYIYSSANDNSKTGMYLIRGDEIVIVKDKLQWVKIRYYGNKTIEGWIKKSDIENP